MYSAVVYKLRKARGKLAGVRPAASNQLSVSEGPYLRRRFCVSVSSIKLDDDDLDLKRNYKCCWNLQVTG